MGGSKKKTQKRINSIFQNKKNAAFGENHRSLGVPPSSGGAADLKKKPAGEALKSENRELSKHAMVQRFQLCGMKKRCTYPIAEQ